MNPTNCFVASPFSSCGKRLLSRIAVLLAFVFVVNGLAPLAARAGEPDGPPATAPAPLPAHQDNPCSDAPSGCGISSGDPVDMATGAETYTAPQDLSIYNPNGPAVTWARTFRSDRAKDGYGSPGLSPGWTHEYDITVQRRILTAEEIASAGPGGGFYSPFMLISANGSAENLTTPGSAPFYTTYETANGDTLSSVTVNWKGGAKWTFTPTTTTNASLYVLSRITKSTGQSIDLAWDTNRRLTHITDTTSSATLLTLSYGGTGQLASATDVYGRKISYNFGTPTGSGLTVDCLLSVSLIALSSASAPPTLYSYGYVSYNGQPMLHTMGMPSPTGAGTSTATINYDNGTGGTGKVTSLVDANGNQRVYTYSGGGTLVQVRNPANAVVMSWTQHFSAENRGTGTTDANNQSDSIYYGDPANPSKPTQVTGKDGRSSTAAYDAHGNITSSTDTRGIISTYTYDYTAFALGRLTETQEGAKPSTTFTYYEPSGLLHTATGPSPTGTGTVMYTLTYDSLGNVLSVTGPGNNASSTITTTYNYTSDGSYSQTAALGQALTVTDNLGHTTHYRYDAQGRITDVADAAGNAGIVTYNLAGQTATASGPATGQTGGGHGYVQTLYQYVGGLPSATRLFDESGAQIRQTAYTYGQEGETLSVAGGTEPVANTYDALYRVKTLVDGNGNVTTYSYDGVGNLSGVVLPGGDTAQFPHYDAAGRVLKRIDGRGIATDYVYNGIGGSLSDVQYPANAGRNIHFDYDGYGRVTSRTDGTGTQGYVYDVLDQVQSVTTTYSGLPSRTIGYSYYADGSRSAMTTPAGTFSYAYDAAGRPASLTNPFGETTSWSYASNDWLTAQTLANGVVTTNTYNALGQATGVKNALGSTTLSEFSAMTHDGAGNRLSVTASVPSASALSGTTSYGYDSKDQLTGETSTRNSSYSNSFGYDAAGNPTTFKGVGKSYNSKNQLISGTSYVYDGNGNPTTYAGTALTFDEENKATAFGTALTAGYTSDGTRAWKQNASSVRTYFLYDGITPVIELDSSGIVAATNTFGANGLVSRRTAGTGASVFYTFDERGNTVQRLGSSGTVLTNHVSDAFGTTASSASTSDPYDGYGAQSGYYTDHETGLVLCTFRYFDPANGRWLTRDPIGYGGGVNLYGYVKNNPSNLLDPLGLEGHQSGVNNTSKDPIWVIITPLSGEQFDNSVDHCSPKGPTAVKDAGGQVHEGWPVYPIKAGKADPRDPRKIIVKVGPGETLGGYGTHVDVDGILVNGEWYHPSGGLGPFVPMPSPPFNPDGPKLIPTTDGYYSPTPNSHPSGSLPKDIPPVHPPKPTPPEKGAKN